MRSPPIQQWLALAQRELARGRPDRACELAAAVLNHQPHRTEALVLLANAKLALDELDGAIEILEQLSGRGIPALKRVLARALNRRGARRLRAGEMRSAGEDLRRALANWPELAEAWFNLALLERALGRRREALEACREALRLAPDDAEARLLAAELEQEPTAALAHLQTLAQALPPPLLSSALRLGATLATRQPAAPRADALLQRLVEADPECAEEQGKALALDGELPAARILFAHAAARRTARGACPLPAVLQSELALGAVPLDRAELTAWRQGFAEGLDRLTARLAQGELHAERVDQLRCAPFLLGYHGEDDRELLGRLGDLLAALAAPLTPPRPSGGRRRRRLALVSSFFRDCTVGHYFASWPPALAEAGFEVSLIQLGPRRDAMTERLAQSADHFLFHEGTLDDLAQRLADGGFDLLLYPELGMDERIFALAALRLAPTQLCAWGHPMTSGLPTIDGFLSVAAMEPADGAQYYREPLVCLPGLGTAYPRPPPPERLDRQALGLPGDAVLVFYPHSPFKIHPDDDELIAALAADQPQLRFVLFEGERPAFRARLERRIGAAFARRGVEAADRLIWLPLMPRPRYLAVAACCDFLLDCRRWSGGNTTLDALSVGLPVLTCEGRFMRARQSAAMLALIGAEDLVAKDEDALLTLARRFTADAELRAAWRRQLAADAGALYERDDFGEALAELILVRLERWPP